MSIKIPLNKATIAYRSVPVEEIPEKPGTDRCEKKVTAVSVRGKDRNGNTVEVDIISIIDKDDLEEQLNQ